MKNNLFVALPRNNKIYLIYLFLLQHHAIVPLHFCVSFNSLIEKQEYVKIILCYTRIGGFCMSPILSIPSLKKSLINYFSNEVFSFKFV